MRAVKAPENGIFCFTRTSRTDESLASSEKRKSEKRLETPYRLWRFEFSSICSCVFLSLLHNKIQASVLLLLSSSSSSYYAYNHVSHFQGNDQTNPNRPCTLTLAPDARDGGCQRERERQQHSASHNTVTVTLTAVRALRSFVKYCFPSPRANLSTLCPLSIFSFFFLCSLFLRADT